MTEDEEFEALEQRLNMKETKQPEALRLADDLNKNRPVSGPTAKDAAAELRRLHEENERLHVENRRLIDRIETMGVPVGVGGYATTTKAQGASNE